MTDTPLDISDKDYPKELWVYNRNGRIEARDSSIVVGNVLYRRATLLDATPDALRKVRDKLEYLASWQAKDGDSVVPEVANEALTLLDGSYPVPEGYVLVKREPTEEMIKAGQTCTIPMNLYSIWGAMCAASPGVEEGRW